MLKMFVFMLKSRLRCTLCRMNNQSISRKTVLAYVEFKTPLSKWYTLTSRYHNILHIINFFPIFFFTEFYNFYCFDFTGEVAEWDRANLQVWSSWKIWSYDLVRHSLGLELDVILNLNVKCIENIPVFIYFLNIHKKNNVRFIHRMSRIFSESTMKRLNLEFESLILETPYSSDFKNYILKHFISKRDILLAHNISDLKKQN